MSNIKSEIPERITLIGALLRGFRKYIITTLTLVSLVAIFIISVAIYNEGSTDQAILLLLSVSNIILIICVLIVAYEYGNLRAVSRAERHVGEKILKGTLLELKEIFSTRTKLSAYYSEFYLNGETSVDVVSGTTAYLNDLIVRTKAIFELQTNDECSVCIKLIGETAPLSDFSDATITRVFRDPSSQAQRMKYDQYEQRIRNNTSLRYIFKDGQVGYFYFNNDLFHSSINGTYTNDSPNWYRRYNATAVCAIKDPDRENPDDIIGFLCVDNMRGGFSPDISCNTLKTLSTSVFYVLKNLALIQEAKSERIPNEKLK